jgi:H+/Cl- antiporter ClcA
MMQAQDYATVAVAVMTIVGGFAAGVRWMVKHYLNELKPNGGSSVKDSIARLERQVEEIYRILLTRNNS